MSPTNMTMTELYKAFTIVQIV